MLKARATRIPVLLPSRQCTGSDCMLIYPCMLVEAASGWFGLAVV